MTYIDTIHTGDCLDIWVIALSQLNRDMGNPVPNLNRLRDSGQIAEAADVVMFIYRPEVYSRSFPDPFHHIATQGRLGMATVKRPTRFLAKNFSGRPEGKVVSIDSPAGAVTARDHHSFISAYNGNGHNHSIDAPAPTLTCKDRLAFVDLQYGNGTPSDIASPAPTVTATPKHKLVTCDRWLLNPQFTSAGGSIDNPCFTLIARMDKMPPYLMTAETKAQKLPPL